MTYMIYSFGKKTLHGAACLSAGIAISSYRDQDGSGGGMLLVRDGRYVISLSVSRELHDSKTQQIFDKTLQEMVNQGNIQRQ